MDNLAEFDRYIEHLCVTLEHQDRNAGLQDYCRGLMLPIHRKSIEPLAAHTDPLHVAARHQSLHHVVANAGWSDSAVMARIRDWVLPHLGLDEGCYWIIDDTGFPKKGTHSVGVARQYCGQLGKQDNWQVAVSLSLASVRAHLAGHPNRRANSICRRRRRTSVLSRRRISRFGRLRARQGSRDRPISRVHPLLLPAIWRYGAELTAAQLLFDVGRYDRGLRECG
jgi:hypothetical protein